uniref:Uncharacterized protein n=1 Tax=Arundo donax TaxID=35708 RepID=A0A0A9EF72_ARUDO
MDEQEGAEKETGYFGVPAGENPHPAVAEFVERRRQPYSNSLLGDLMCIAAPFFPGVQLRLLYSNIRV